MDEATIQAQLSQGMPTEEPATTSPRPPADDPIDPDALHNNLPLENAITRNEVMDYFNLNSRERMSEDMKTRVDAIVQWARETTGSTELVDIFQAIRRQEGRMGIRFAPNKIDRLVRHIVLDRQISALNEKQRALYG